MRIKRINNINDNTTTSIIGTRGSGKGSVGTTAVMSFLLSLLLSLLIVSSSSCFFLTVRVVAFSSTTTITTTTINMKTRMRTTTSTSLFTPTASATASRTIGLSNQQPEQQQKPIGMLFSMTSSLSSLSSTASDTDIDTSDTSTTAASDRKPPTTTASNITTPNNNSNSNKNHKNKFQQRPDFESSKSRELTNMILERIRSKSTILGQEYADTFGLDTDYDNEEDQNNEKVRQYTSAGLYAVLDAIKTTLIIRKEKESDDNTIGFGLSSHPFVLRKQELEKAMVPSDLFDLSDFSSDSSTSVKPNKSKSKSKSTSKFVLFDGAYTMRDLEQAVEDDFLDASRGSTDNRKGWKIAPVSIPKGDSFEEARMTYDDILLALNKGTVIFNAFGAHVPKLAGPCLACTDATHTPNAVNLYVTKYNMRTSAPPHTDKQDVIVVQTNGKKKWRVYQPTLPALKPNADIFARGKGEDNLPLYVLEKNTNNKNDPSDTTNTLLLETELGPGDVLFLPAGFPHTTGTVYQEDEEEEDDDDDKGDDEEEEVTDDKAGVVDKTSVHLTFNIDTHIWELDYLNARRLVLRKANVVDYKLGQSRDVDNIYVGRVNEIPTHLHRDLFQELPLGFLNPDEDTDDSDSSSSSNSYCSVEYVTKELKRIAKAVDEDTFNAVGGDSDSDNDDIWKETVLKLKEHGQELVEIHRDMYLAAMEEERTRIFEQAMSAASKSGSGSESAVGSDGTTKKTKKKLTPEQVQRLSLFRVKKYYEKIDQVKANLLAWSYESKPSAAVVATIDEETGGSTTTTAESGSQGGTTTTIVAAKAKTGALPENWAFVMPMKVGDEVEADLGGAFFPATIIRVLPGTVGLYDLTFFDGDQEKGMERKLIKLLKPPAMDNDDDDQVDTSTMTPKQLKRWKKAQKKKKQ